MEKVSALSSETTPAEGWQIPSQTLELPVVAMVREITDTLREPTREAIAARNIIPQTHPNWQDSKKPKGLILDADGIIDDFGFFDFKETLEQGFFREHGVFDGGTIALYGTEQKCALLSNMIKSANRNINVQVIDKGDTVFESESDELDYVAKQARRAARRLTSVEHEFIGLIKSKTKEAVSLKLACRDIDMPIVVLSNNNGIYSFRMALTEAFNRKYSGDKASWLCYLQPVERLSEETARQLRRRILEEMEILTKA